MDNMEVRPFSSSADYERAIDYFLTADDAYLLGMGVDRGLLPDRDSWLRMLVPDLERDDPEKQAFYVAWIYNGEAIGHSNINKIRFGEEAFIHLHMYKPDLRKAGLGAEFFKRSAQTFVERFKLKRLLCEPWAGNEAPNRVLLKVGFRFLRKYRTVPSLIQFEQEVNRYELTTSRKA